MVQNFSSASASSSRAPTGARGSPRLPYTHVPFARHLVFPEVEGFLEPGLAEKPEGVVAFFSFFLFNSHDFSLPDRLIPVLELCPVLARSCWHAAPRPPLPPVLFLEITDCTLPNQETPGDVWLLCSNRGLRGWRREKAPSSAGKYKFWCLTHVCDSGAGFIAPTEYSGLRYEYIRGGYQLILR